MKLETQNMKHKNKILIVLVFILVVVVILWFVRDNDVQVGQFDFFAQCLSEKEVVMYGAEWCSHCQNEKKAFSQSFQYINYVECPKDPNKCLAVGIEGYPTWVFPGGRKLVGEQGVEKLSAESGCRLTN